MEPCVSRARSLHVAVIDIDGDAGQDGAHELLVVPFLHHEELEPRRDELGERLL